MSVPVCDFCNEPGEDDPTGEYGPLVPGSLSYGEVRMHEDCLNEAQQEEQDAWDEAKALGADTPYDEEEN